MAYYSDLSAADSSGGEDDSDEDDDFALAPTGNNRHATTISSQLQTVILHVDIDCFYCQCEHLDRKLPTSQPLAVGQKHIIVTSNYAARAEGVKKLQLREDAYKACPNLLIVEGSDLERYRKHGRKMYDALRDCVQNEFSMLKADGMLPPAVSRGRGMDEMQADLTSLVDALPRDAQNTKRSNDEKPIYIYGEYRETATLTEDQTGAEAVVQAYDPSLEHCRTISSQVKTLCQTRLLNAAEKLGRAIQQTILERTGFTTTLGISVNPLLAKLASDLQKPSSVNVLYPWRAPPLIASMPLRKIPDAGHRTIKLLKPVLEQYHGSRKGERDAFWTCQDLLRLPTSEVKRVIESEEKCTMLLQRCRGLDTTTIVDDQGEAPKTISCENSFRRGTVVTPEAVWKGMEELYVRLPRLLKDRREWSQHPQKAYPMTLRLTARVVDKSLLGKFKRRRPFVTRSKQIPFARGRELLDETDSDRQKAIVQNTVRPLVRSLVLDAVKPGDLNVTRLNIAVTNFQDVTDAADLTMHTQGNSPGLTQQSLTMAHFSSPGGLSQPASSFSSQKRNQSTRHSKSSLESAFKKQRHAPPSQPASAATPRSCPSQTKVSSLPNGIDPNTLAELPPEMVNDIIRDYNHVVSSRDSTKSKAKAKAGRIDHFFARRN